MYNQTDYTGNLGVSGGTCFCWGYKVFNDSWDNSSPLLYPKMRIYQGTISNQILWADYIGNTVITENSNWISVCAPPIKIVQNTLPADSNGMWVMSPGSTIADWNALVSNVSGIAFNTDVAGSPTQDEVIGVDNICVRQCCPTFTSDVIPAFNFENESGVIESEFCYGDDVYLDGVASQGEESYFIDVWRRVAGSSQNFSIYATLGWTSAQVGLVNLSEEMANLNTSKYFEPGYEYEVKLALASSQNCVNWISIKDAFTIECCEDYFEAEFESSQDTNGNIQIIAFNSYENTSVTHQWYVFSSSNPGTGPYSVVYNATSALVAPFTFNFTTQPEKYYTVIHKVTTPCEEVCYKTEHYFNKSGKGAKLEKTSNSNLDCSVIDDILCEISAPGNLQVVGGNTLTWDPVPGAVSYVITSSSDPQGPDCGCEEVYIEPMTTTTNSYVMTGELMNNCFAWQVTAICANGNESLISRASCYNPNNQVPCSTIPPANLQVIGTTLSWNPVPGAVSYTVHSPSGNTTPIDCGCIGEFFFGSIITTTNSYALPSGVADQCFAWQVTANCANGDRRSPSGQACYPEVEGDIDGEVVEKVTIHPNPNNGVMEMKIETQGDNEVIFNIYTFDGILVKTINNNKTVNGVLKLNVDLRRLLTKGLYFFTFNTGKQTITKKVMIE